MSFNTYSGPAPWESTSNEKNPFDTEKVTRIQDTSAFETKSNFQSSHKKGDFIIYNPNKKSPFETKYGSIAEKKRAVYIERIRKQKEKQALLRKRLRIELIKKYGKINGIIKKENFIDYTKNVAHKLSTYERSKIISRAPLYIKNLVKKYFPKEEYENALLVCNGESSFNAKAINHNNDRHHSVDRGLFQINEYYHSDKYEGKDIFDPEVNVQVAAQIFKQRGNRWNDWYAARKIGLWK